MSNELLRTLEIELMANALVLSRYRREGRDIFDMTAALDGLEQAAARYEAERDRKDASDRRRHDETLPAVCDVCGGMNSLLVQDGTYLNGEARMVAVDCDACTTDPPPGTH